MKTDIGHNVQIELEYKDGQLEYIGWFHRCTDHDAYGIISLKPGSPNGWDLIKLDPLTNLSCA
jgi:hypothetical protein